MNAEHLLQFVDELDEYQIWLREAIQPPFVAAALFCLLGVAVTVMTRSPVLGLVSLVLMTWTGLIGSLALQRVRDRSG